MSAERFFLFVAAGIAIAVAGFALRLRSKQSYAGIIFALGMLCLGVETVLACLSATSLLLSDVLAWQRWRLLTLAFLPGCWLLFSLTYARGNEREYLARWKPVVVATFALPLGVAVLGWNELLSGETEAGPNAMWMLLLGRSGVVLHVLFLAGAVLCLMNLESTLRESMGTMRWRVKYMIVGVGLLFAVRCYSSIQSVLYSSINVDLTGLNAGALVVGCVFMIMALSRGSLSAVDLYPSHSALYGSLTVIIAGAYLLLVGLLAESAAYFGLGASFPLQAFLAMVALGGVTMLLLSDRLRQRAKRFVSLHFRRPQYDYRRVWSAFTERTASLTDPAEFCREMTRLVSDTFQVLAATIWVVDEQRRSFAFGGSTSLSEGEARALTGDGKLGSELTRMLREHAYPTPVLDVEGELGDLLHRLSRKEFKKGGAYYFLPLTTREEVLGVLILGDRVNGLPFTVEEFDLMRIIGNQIVAVLLSIRLSKRLGEAQKLEAFQTMSAFFVHDLKNTASTLSLMLQNLPKHFDDPGFRQDALRAIAKSVDKINALIVRLSCFRQKMDIKPVPGDLNAVVKSALTGLSGCDPATVTLQLAPLPLVPIDADQIQKVVTNLILNARDALRSDGRICIRTESRTREVALEVSDNGCGMAPEFIEGALFRPFQTTKPEGLGIGLFHSKMIVDAHRGRIEVESRRDEGTTFRVILPFPGGQS